MTDREKIVERLRPSLDCVERDDHTYPRAECEKSGKCAEIIAAVQSLIAEARLEEHLVSCRFPLDRCERCAELKKAASEK